jgi:hypothetical protein
MKYKPVTIAHMDVLDTFPDKGYGLICGIKRLLNDPPEVSTATQL